MVHNNNVRLITIKGQYNTEMLKLFKYIINEEDHLNIAL